MLMSYLGIVIKLVNLIMAVKKNYDEQLNYEKVQSELLKSRVTIMISQIQPHFFITHSLPLHSFAKKTQSVPRPQLLILQIICVAI